MDTMTMNVCCPSYLKTYSWFYNVNSITAIIIITVTIATDILS